MEFACEFTESLNVLNFLPLHKGDKSDTKPTSADVAGGIS